MNYFFLISYTLIFFLGLEPQSLCKADDSPGFFVKIAKNVPRLGRRSDKPFTRRFFRNYKIIPRIGRSVEELPKSDSLNNWLDTPFTVHMEKRLHYSPASRFVDQDLSLLQPVNAATLKELIDSHTIARENVKFIHWKDFDRALQMDPELFGKISSIGRTPDQHLKDNLSKENFTPVLKNMMDSDGTDFVLYTQGENDQGVYAPEFLRYNIM
ncbi:uncharacterized protein LOC101896054 [Musca domestica]|uniref:Uncharacterized protein LOC101896054 n=1 Tax=Musca domestica TaxID=7370 RepID=A0A1I8MDU4_MUSDO|nr:uncharacterized protein LOC101896054 [Musca domestica]